jgi:hypothetical protein
MLQKRNVSDFAPLPSAPDSKSRRQSNSRSFFASGEIPQEGHLSREQFSAFERLYFRTN